LLFSRIDVAKEFENLRKWTKKMSKIRLDETLLCKIRRVYILNGPKGLKRREREAWVAKGGVRGAMLGT
jgi:hypothetical protein